MTRFRSDCSSPVVAAKNAVKAPTKVTAISAVLLYSIIGEERTSKYTPAVQKIFWTRSKFFFGLYIYTLLIKLFIIC
jgi:hypothetical protein